MKQVKITAIRMWLVMLPALLMTSCGKHQHMKGPGQQMPVVILDTDMASSTDDLLLLSALYHLTETNTIKLAAIMINRNGEVNAKMADIMNTYYHHPEVEIGVTRQGPENATVWIDYWKMCEPGLFDDEPVFPRTLSDTAISHLPDAAVLYRRILSSSDDHGVLIFSAGFANNLSRLLESGPDEYSPLDGVELVRQKVQAIYLQAGYYGAEAHPDYNFQSDPHSAMTLMTKWPAPMFFSPQEAGDPFNYLPEEILADLEAAGMTDSPLYHVYRHHPCDEGQRMWDVMTLLGWLQPELFYLYGPYDIGLSEEMIPSYNPPRASSNRYILFPDLNAQEQIRKLIRGSVQQFSSQERPFSGNSD